ncbi:chaperonin 10-like protein [Dactylonectria estremocensis]|uniref:Chaperonin 10-like protein n=1 Tax=Dactylonectria estremocensis TaxID=1079267 RepID=A0A9P9DD90_9HYPO|nr:chaperonin 10-like protein [Dactylonectria estremocensis]
MPSILPTQSEAQVLFGPKDLRLISRPISLPNEDEVQVAMRATTLCGSDLHYFAHFRNGDIRIKEPLSQGHESAGIIVAVGSHAEIQYGLEVGDRVALEVGVPCDECEECQDGAYNVCEKMRFRSSATAFPHFQGTLQERVNHPAKWVHKLPDSITYAQGALLEPLAVAVHSVRKAAAKAGSSCLILGAGAVGLLCAAAAKVDGYSYVVMADIAQNRLDFAKDNSFADAILLLESKKSQKLGEALLIAEADAAKLTALNSAGKFHRTFECTGVESCVRVAIYATRGGGKVLLVGMGTPIQTLPLSAAALREVSLVGVWRYTNCYPRALEIVNHCAQDKNLPDVRKLITHTFNGLASVPDAFTMAARTSDDKGALVVKVVVEIPE